jgi:tripartite-type tricarboxylate transporter receptor subunit TctC
MKLPRRQFLHLAAGAAALPALSGFAWAQAYPIRPIMIVDTFPPGGSTGIIARIIADKFSETLGQQVIVDQRAGAGGTVAAKQVARSTPDGYTIMLGFTGTLGIAPSLYPNAGYDPRKDFAPVGRIGVAPNSLVVHPSFPVRSVAELIAYAKQNPGKVNFGSAGIGTVGHVAGELLASMAGIKLAHVPYRGTGPNLTDLLGGHIPMSFAPIPATYENTKNGLLRMLGVTSRNRSSLLPGVPRNGVHYLVQPVIGRPGSPLAAQSAWTTGNNVRIDIRWATSNAAEIRRHADWWCSLQMSSSKRPTCEREPIHCESEHRIPLQS